MSRRRPAILALKLTVSAGLLWLIYRNIPFPELVANISGIRLRPMPAILGLLLLNTWLSAYKWQILLSANGVRVPLRRLFASYLIGSFFNIFLPSNVGGDAYRIYDVARRDTDAATSFSSVLADRLSGFLALAVLAVVGSLFVAPLAGMPSLILASLAALALLVAAVGVLVHGAQTRRLLTALGLDRLPGVRRFAFGCLDAFGQYARQPRLAARIMIISFGFQLSVVLCVVLLSRCLGLRVELPWFFAFVPLISLVEALPISIYGLGLRDAAYVFFFGLSGIGPVQTRAMALLYVAVNVAYAMLGGVLLAARTLRFDSQEQRRVTGRARLIVALAMTFTVWAWFAWPLPRSLSEGIPSASRNIEVGNERHMIAGDHLQLMYHCWLAGDMISGGTEPFVNAYEFNAGDDAKRFEPGSYYVPFSLVYSLLALVGGRAFGWNMTGLISLFVTYLLTWLLARRYTRHEWWAALAALASIALPYRWATLLGGSPTGFAMSLVPMLLLGLDLAVRDDRVAGGVTAGLAVVLAFCSDLHVFFFSVLVVPCWCIFAFAARRNFAWGNWRSYWRLAVALAPVAALTGVAGLLSRITARELGVAVFANGWTFGELTRYAPHPSGLFTWRYMGMTNHVFLGYGFTGLLIAGIAFAIEDTVRGRRGPTRRLTAMLLCAAGVIGIATLALGTNGPFEAIQIRACRKLIPPYRMVRQTAKVFCLLPSVLAVGGALSLGTLRRGSPLSYARTAVLLALMGLAILECRSHVDPTICKLDREQAAYEAVALDAAEDGTAPRALVLPLWPGNSHWSSLYLHHASQYHIRLVNGYRPAVPIVYLAEMYQPFESANAGVLSAQQVTDLRQRGIHYVMLHEDAFPEKVSAFPVGLTLQRLLNHPRLELLSHAQNVWAFKLAEQPRTSLQPVSLSPFLFPTRRGEAERLRAPPERVGTDAGASAGRYLEFRPGDALQTFALRSRVGNVPDLRWELRVRGKGALACQVGEGKNQEETILDVDSDGWTWMAASARTKPAFLKPDLTVTGSQGRVEIDMALLAGGPWPPLQVGEQRRIPASAFFRAGYTDPENGSVVFRKTHDPDGAVFYGPLLPLPQGDYTLSLDTETEAPDGAKLGALRVASAEAPAQTDVVAGDPTRLSFQRPANLPLRVEFVYSRRADMIVRALTIERLR